MNKPQAKVSRRTFLLGAAAGTAATAAAIVGRQESPTSSPQEKNKKSASGYQLTEHVRNYYRTAKI
jgi:hypothetical protein